MKAMMTGLLGLVCVSALVPITSALAQEKDPAGVNPAHYQCYRISEVEAFKPLGVTLADQFGKAEVKVLKPVMLCAPVSKNRAAVKDSKTHLVCYEDEGLEPANKKVAVINQFGKATLTVGGPAMLCVPSLKTVIK